MGVEAELVVADAQGAGLGAPVGAGTDVAHVKRLAAGRGELGVLVLQIVAGGQAIAGGGEVAGVVVAVGGGPGGRAGAGAGDRADRGPPHRAVAAVSVAGGGIGHAGAGGGPPTRRQPWPIPPVHVRASRRPRSRRQRSSAHGHRLPTGREATRPKTETIPF